MQKNIALIGVGYWGKNYLRNLHELGVIHSVMDVSDEVRANKSKEYPTVQFVKDENTILNNKNIEAVIIAAPAALHYELTKKYLLAGKDVLVEKPLAMTVQEGEELVQIAEKEKRILMVGHILQYHSAIHRLKEIIDFGDIGEIRYIYSNRLNLGKLRIEENVLWSFAPHDISVILMLMNDTIPKNVHAFGASYITKGVYDTTVTEMEFENNVQGHIYVSWLHPYKEQKLVVIGTKKMAVFDDRSSEKLVLYPYKVDFFNGKIPVAQRVEYYVVKTEQSEPLRNEIIHFLDCIKSRKSPKTDGREGVRVLKVISSAEKRIIH